MKPNLALLLAASAALLAGCGGGSSGTPAAREQPAAQQAEERSALASALAIPGGPVVGSLPARLDPRLRSARGEIELWVTLAEPSLAARKRELRPLDTDVQWKATDAAMRSQLHGHRQALRASQDSLMSSLASLGAREIARVSVAHNAVAIRVDASKLNAVAGLSGVVAVRPVVHYQRQLSETVPYIGAARAQAAGVDGRGVTVAVLDSGIDYTHRNLGGAGTEAAYAAAYSDPADPAGFPTAKVVKGFDFVGESWPACPPDTDCRSEDPDPIDAPNNVPVTDGGHGTHVADIIAGVGRHKGVAPGAKLMAIKVCSAVSTACNGIALLKAVDFALDPDGDGALDDAADVLNLSLGSDYGQKEDDLSVALANAVRLGAIVVASAGNGANKPYIVGSPSTALEVISVAQTQVPSAKAFPLVVTAPPAIAGTYLNTSTVDWAPVGDGFSGSVVALGRGCPAGSIDGSNPADPYTGAPSGKVALIDRGACAVSLKVDRAARAGATAVLIANNAPGDPPTFSLGGGDRFVPTLVITQALGASIKAQLTAGNAVNVSVSSAVSVALVGGVVASSSRGPDYSFNRIKPDIAAPGASVSALVGTGDGTEAFGGTSGAAPMVSGAAALLRQKFPHRSPAAIKSLLMNTAETQVFTNPATQPGVLAPITRIGGGEVRVDAALASTLAAWDAKANTGSLSFGYHTLDDDDTFTRRVTVHNYGHAARTLRIKPSFRYADDESLGAVQLDVPDSVDVPAHGRASFDVTLKVTAAKLPLWTLDGGFEGGNGALLNVPEFDGYLTLGDGHGKIHLAWQILPHRVSDIDLSRRHVSPGERVRLSNDGTIPGPVDVFSLTGISPRINKSELPQPGDNFAVIDLRWVGVRLAAPGILQFAVSTYGRRAHPNYPAEFDIYLDINRDGVPDYLVFNAENGGFGATGQNVVFVWKLKADGSPDGLPTAFFFTDANLNSANAVLTIPLEAVGMTGRQRFNFDVYAFDNYFTGAQTDAVTGMRYTPAKPRFIGTGVPAAGVPAGGSSVLSVRAVAGGAAASPSQSGLLLLYRDGGVNNEASTIVVTP